MTSEHHSVVTDGDDIVVETPFGTATFELKGASEAADENLRDGHGEWPDDFCLEDRWLVLFEEVDAVLGEWAREEL